MRNWVSPSWDNERPRRAGCAGRRPRPIVRLQPVAYEVEFPEGFISIDELFERVITPEDEARLPEARRKFAEQRVLRTKKTGLADLRLRNGLTQKQLADLANVTQPRLSLWEGRKEKPSIDHVRLLAGALNTDCNTIIGAILDE